LTFEEAQREGAAFLARALGETARSEADYLLCAILGVERLDLFRHSDRPLNRRELDLFKRALDQRARRIPLAYITGRREFFGLTFRVAGVLIPRPESECLVEFAQSSTLDSPAVLDLCCGSGCLGIAFAYSQQVSLLHFADIDSMALQTAAENARTILNATDFSCMESDGFKNIGAEYDLIFCNPPYVSIAEYARLEPELHYEPVHALIKTDPYDFAAGLLLDGLQRLKGGGMMLLEATESIIRSLLDRIRHKHAVIQPGFDAAGQIRFIVMQKKAMET